MEQPVEEYGTVGLSMRRTSTDRFVENRSQPVDIGPAITATVQPLGRHVAQRAKNVAGVGQRLGLFGIDRQPEVSDPYRAAAVEQDVRRLDVAMDHALSVSIREGLGHLLADPGRPETVLLRRRGISHARAVRRAFFFENLVKTAAVDELHHVEMPALMLAHAEDRDDVGVVQPSRRPRLAAKAGQTATLRKQLERHVSIERSLVGLVHDTHATTADFADDAIIVQLRRGRRIQTGMILVIRCLFLRPPHPPALVRDHAPPQIHENVVCETVELGHSLFASRARREMNGQLFELEVAQIADGVGAENLRRWARLDVHKLTF